ncbi:MAG: DUF4158 domain-containing protein [Acidimicrobiales bacterium]
MLVETLAPAPRPDLRARQVLPDDELERLSTWPPHVVRSDLVAHFTLSLEDRPWVRSHRRAEERIGLAVQLCTLGFLGFVPADLAAAPREVVASLPARSAWPRPPSVATHRPPMGGPGAATMAMGKCSDRYLLGCCFPVGGGRRG